MNKKLSLFVAVLLLLTMLLPGAASAELKFLSSKSMLAFTVRGGRSTTQSWIATDDDRAVLVGAVMVDLTGVYPYETIIKAAVTGVGNVYVAKSVIPDTLVVYFDSFYSGLLIVEFNMAMMSIDTTVMSDVTSEQMASLLSGNAEYWIVDKALIGEKYAAAWSLKQLLFR